VGRALPVDPRREQHWARSGTSSSSSGCNVSQAGAEAAPARAHRRARAGNWKFAIGDVAATGRVADYMEAYQDALAATSRPWAPWYAIPADSKSFMRRTVAEIIVQTLDGLGLAYPTLSDKQRAELQAAKAQLEAE
jgi:hypothetical protein